MVVRRVSAGVRAAVGITFMTSVHDIVAKIKARYAGARRPIARTALKLFRMRRDSEETPQQFTHRLVAALRKLKERAVEEWGATEMAPEIVAYEEVTPEALMWSLKAALVVVDDDEDDVRTARAEREWAIVEKRRPTHNHQHNRRHDSERPKLRGVRVRGDSQVGIPLLWPDMCVPKPAVSDGTPSLSCASWGIPSPERSQGNQVLSRYGRVLQKVYPQPGGQVGSLDASAEKRVWSSCSQRKEALIHAPVLRYPDFTRQFVLTTDASGVAVVAVLSQFKMRTDHKPLMWVERLKENSARVARWEETLAAYDLDMGHTRGAKNVVTECLSRLINATKMPEGPEPFALRHLRGWAESGPDLPSAEPGSSGVQEQRLAVDGLRRLNNKRRQVVLESGTGDGVVTSHLRYARTEA
ncbi:hypothetical protein AAG570_012461 [Ranatra chinensis]|uniref:Reverse transcriptase/retrotransposon-derived protein RNase H-like domain-containing protein n=1 Tax=Ranatra chinensis TaxID=642074 RepID=A0ABD0YE79_9HEMI